jgi:hypothetical protein
MEVQFVGWKDEYEQSAKIHLWIAVRRYTFLGYQRMSLLRSRWIAFGDDVLYWYTTTIISWLWGTNGSVILRDKEKDVHHLSAKNGTVKSLLER